jgi:hypothetical protein
MSPKFNFYLGDGVRDSSGTQRFYQRLLDLNDVIAILSHFAFCSGLQARNGNVLANTDCPNGR